MKKHKIEDMCRNARMAPVSRGTIEGAEVFIADGFSSPPHVYHQRWLEPGEFPYGCFVTLWWLSKGEDNLDIGQPLFFDALKAESRQQHARVNTAMKEARDFYARRKKVRLNG